MQMVDSGMRHVKNLPHVWGLKEHFDNVVIDCLNLPHVWGLKVYTEENEGQVLICLMHEAQNI